jgi:cobalt-zinc-cadmium efflux system outer membrane protein
MWLVGFFLFSGCTSIAMNAGFKDVSATVKERSALEIFWNNGNELDKEAADEVASLLQRNLTAEGAVQIALLNNRELQAAYSELGIAQADLVQAGLLGNPIFDASVMFPPSGGGRPDLDLSAAMNFLNILYIPLRKRVAAARFEEVKTRIAGSVLDFAGRVRSSFYLHQSNEQMLELRQTIVQALAASSEIARRLHDAGNISDLDFARERAQFEGGKLAARSAEVSVRKSREELNILMGLWGEQTEWKAEAHLPEIPQEPLQTQDVERLAVSRSLDLAHARQRILATGEQLGLNRWTSLLPGFEAGPSAERKEGSWEIGPQVDFAIPLFDQGQGRIGRSTAELRRLQQEYFALAVRVRAKAREVRDRAEGARDRAMYYRDILLPLHEHIVNEAQLQYNAMQLGGFELLRARQEQIQTAVGYIETLRDYWLARGDIGQILSGRLPNTAALQISRTGAQTGMNGMEGH